MECSSEPEQVSATLLAPPPVINNARPRKLGLLLDVRTRWNASYVRLRRYVDLRPAVEMYIASDDSLKQYALLNAEWELLDELLKLFKPLYIATVGLSQSKYVSMRVTLPIYIGLMKVFTYIFIYSKRETNFMAFRN